MAIFIQKPMQWQCSKCEWRDSLIQHSDVLTPRPLCPKCGSETKLKVASSLDVAYAKLGKLFSR